MSNATCFDPSTLKDYLLGKLSDEQSDAIAAHLEACLSCEATVSQLDRASDTLTDGLRLPPAAPEPATDAELQKVLEKVQSLEPAAERHETSEVCSDRSPVLRDYRLLEPLGSGGMGTVYKAVHTRLDRLVAVKLLPARRLGDEQAVARFQREMRVIGQLSHPAIVQATDAGEVDGTHFLVMEYVEGFDLNHIAKSCGPLSIADACEITRQAALGLEYAHQQGIVHRDIKPSNLMLSRESRVQSRELEQSIAKLSGSQLSSLNSRLSIKILDLGLALLSGEQAPVDELTTVGQLMGTLDYMAPEQLEDSHLVGPRADIYALAATLYRLLTGFAPFAKDDRKTPLQKLRALATQAAPPIRERRADLPEELAAAIDRALQREPAERFASMTEFAAAIAPLCQGHDLIGLAQQANELVRDAPNKQGSPAMTIGKGVARSDIGSPVSPNGQSVSPERSVPHRPRRRTLVTALLAFIGFVAFGIVIAIETNKGKLIIESMRDGVEVRVKKSGRVVEQLEVSRTAKSTKLAAGEYEVELVGDADGLKIDQHKIVLTRGDVVVAKVVEAPSAQDVADAMTEMTKPGTVRRGPSEDSRVDEPSRPAAEPDNEQPNSTAKSIDDFLASNPEWQAEAEFREAMRTRVEPMFEDTPLTDVIQFLQDVSKVPLWLDQPALTDEGTASDTPITARFKDVSLATALRLMLRPLQLTVHWDGTSASITTVTKANEKLASRSYPVGRSLPMVRKAVRLHNEKSEQARKAVLEAGGKPVQIPRGGGGFFDVPVTVPLSLDRLHFQFGGGAPTGAARDSGGKVKEVPVPALHTTASYYEELFALLPGASWMTTDGEGGTLQLLGDVLIVRQTRPVHEQIESVLRILEQAAAGPLPRSPVEIRRPDYPSEADQKLRDKLSKPADAEFTDVPLNDVIQFLEDRMEIQILLDKDKFTEEGLALDVPITLSIKSLPFQAVLHRLLDPLNLAADIEEGLLIVTTKSALRERLVPKVYEVRDLLARGVDAQELIVGLQSGTSGPWLDVDGEQGEAMVFADRLLFVTQTQPVHDEIDRLLRDLRTQLSEQPAKRPLANTKPQQTLKVPLTSGTNKPPASQPTQPTVEPAVTNQPRYDGKTFDEWLAVLEVERSPARQREAYEALRLLKTDAQEAMLARNLLARLRSDYAVGLSGGNATADIDRLLSSLKPDFLKRALDEELSQGNSRSRLFSLVILRNKPEFDLRSKVLQISHDTDTEVRREAIWWLAQSIKQHSKDPAIETVRSRLREALSDTSSVIRFYAARGLLDSEADSKAVAAALVGQLENPQSGLRVSALESLAVMGGRASDAALTIAQLKFEPNDEPLNSTTISWLSPKKRDRRGFSTFSERELAVLALARMGKLAAVALPTINEILANTRDRMDLGLSLDADATGGELVRATKLRIEETPAPEKLASSEDLKNLERDLSQVTAMFKLLRLEIEFLRANDRNEEADELSIKSKTLSEESAAGLLRRKQLREQQKSN